MHLYSKCWIFLLLFSHVIGTSHLSKYTLANHIVLVRINRNFENSLDKSRSALHTYLASHLSNINIYLFLWVPSDQFAFTVLERQWIHFLSDWHIEARVIDLRKRRAHYFDAFWQWMTSAHSRNRENANKKTSLYKYWLQPWKYRRAKCKTKRHECRIQDCERELDKTSKKKQNIFPKRENTCKEMQTACENMH